VDSPRLGFRRATVTSWALVGVGIAGVAGASTLAYGDTVKSAVVDVPADATVPEPEVLLPSPAETLPPTPVVTTTEAAPPPPPSPETPTPPVLEYTPEYTPEPTVEQPPAPVTQEAPAPRPSAPPSTKRRNVTPTTVKAPNYSPHITVSHGS